MEFQRLFSKLANYPVTRWFKTELKALALDLRNMMLKHSAVISGGVVSGGTISASALGVSTTAANTKLNGVLKATLAALVDVDLFTTAGNVARATYANGTTAAAISLGTDETARVTLIATDSNGSGGATGDNGAPLYLAVVAGTSTTFELATQFLTDDQIRTALLAATGVHDGATGFVRLADILWDENSASPVATVTVNRDA